MTLIEATGLYLYGIIVFLTYDWVLFPCGKRAEIFEARDKILKSKLRPCEREILKILDKPYLRGILIFLSWFLLLIIFSQRKDKLPEGADGKCMLPGKRRPKTKCPIAAPALPVSLSDWLAPFSLPNLDTAQDSLHTTQSLLDKLHLSQYIFSFYFS